MPFVPHLLKLFKLYWESCFCKSQSILHYNI